MTIGRITAINGLFWFALALYVAVLPIKHTTALRYVALVLLLTATVGLLVRTRQWPRLPLATAWMAYGAVALVSLFYAVSPSVSASEIRVEIGYCALVFAVAALWARHLDMLRGFGFIVAGVNLALGLIAFRYAGFQTSMADVLDLPPLARAGVNSNLIVCILPVLVFLGWDLWRSGKRALAAGIVLLVLPMDAAALIIAYTRQALLAIAAATVCAAVLILRRRFTWRRMLGFGAVLLVVASLFVVQMVRRVPQSDEMEQLVHDSVAKDVRWELWQFSLARIAEHPWSGGGFGRGVFDKLYPDFRPEDPLLWHAHNMVINKGIQMGVPGIVAFLFLWFALARALARHLDTSPRRHALAVAALSTLAAVFVKNMTDDFFVRDVALLFWLVMGTLIGSLEYQENLEKDARGPGRLSG